MIKKDPIAFRRITQSITNVNYKTYLDAVYLDFNYQAALQDKVADLNNKQFTIKDVVSGKSSHIKYIDFWASWCAPCREEFKFYEKLLNTFGESKIDFVTVSIDKSKEALKVENLDNRFNNYFYPNPSKENLILFRLETIPRYMIVDGHGKILNFDAPRPSDSSLIIILEKLLKANK